MLTEMHMVRFIEGQMIQKIAGGFQLHTHSRGKNNISFELYSVNPGEINFGSS